MPRLQLKQELINEIDNVFYIIFVNHFNSGMHIFKW